MKMSKKKEGLILLIIILAGAIVRLQALDFGLPTEYVRPDEEVIIKRAMGFFTGDLNPHFFFYPTFYLYLTFVPYIFYYLLLKLSGAILSIDDFFALFILNLSPFHLISRSISAVSGIISIYLIYLLAKKIYSKEIGLLSGLFLSLAYLHARDSHFGTTDVPLTLMVILSYIFITDILLSGRRYLLAGIFGGLAASMKYNGAILAFPILVAHLLNKKNPEESFIKKIFDKKLFISAIVMILSFLFVSPYILLDYKPFLKGMKIITRAVNEGIEMKFDIGWIFYSKFTLRYGIGIPLLLVSLLGIAYLIYRHKKEDILLLSFPLLYYLLIGNSYGVFSRYMIPVIPFLCIFAAVAVYNFISSLSFLKKYSLIVSFVISIIILFPSIYSLMNFNKIISMEDTRNLALNWIDRNIPSGSRIYMHGHYEYELPLLQKDFENIKEDISFIKKDLKGNPNFIKLIGLEYLLKKGNYPLKPNFHILRGESEYLDEKALINLSPDYIITTEYYLDYYSSDSGKLDNFLKKFCTHLKSFYPYDSSGEKPKPLFDPLDAFYVPYTRPDGITNPGPIIHIYRVLYNIKN